MKRNAFTADRYGVINHYEPDFTPRCEDTVAFHCWQKTNTQQSGGTICLSPYITIEALMSLMDIIKGELTERAKSTIENK